jgi:hypothetical protein
VMPLETDADEDYDDMTSVNTESHSISGGDNEPVHGTNRASEHQTLYHPYHPQKQPGRMMRRASHGPSNYSSSSNLDDSISMSIDGRHSPRKKKLYVTKPTI